MSVYWVSCKIIVISTSAAIADILGLEMFWWEGENDFTVAVVFLKKMCPLDQEVGGLFYPYLFLPNILLVLRMPSYVDT